MTKTAVSLFLLACSAASAAASPIAGSAIEGVRLRSSGKIVISNDANTIRATQIEKNRKKTLVEFAATPRAAAALATGGRHIRVPDALAAIFDEAAQRYALDPVLLAAVARQESRFHPRAVSPAGARGIMQLMPATAAQLGVTDAFDPWQNIHAGARYLKSLLEQFGGDLDLSLAAYNAGPNAVRKYRGVPPYRETTAYVAAIRRDYEVSRAQRPSV